MQREETAVCKKGSVVEYVVVCSWRVSNPGVGYDWKALSWCGWYCKWCSDGNTKALRLHSRLQRSHEHLR